LHLTLPEKAKRRTQTDIELEDSIKSEFVEIILPNDCSVIGKQIVQLRKRRSFKQSVRLP